jgi:AcrR family transcriptional regulator
VPEPATAKAERTRTAIIDAALELFRERGYDATTMRSIAESAGVSVGNAYYYFASKEELIQGLYDSTQEQHGAAVAPILETTSDLEARIVATATSWIDLMQPYHPFAGKFFKYAAEPTSPLSPFSPESSPARASAVQLWRTVLQGSDAKVPRKLQAEIPELLWLFHMVVVMFWVYDQTPGSAATRRLVARIAPMIVKAIALARLPIVRGLLDDVIGVVNELRLVFATAPTSAVPG